MELSWARRLRDECKQYNVAFFMKQLGSVYARAHRLRNRKGEELSEFPEDLQIQEFPRIRSPQWGGAGAFFSKERKHVIV